MNAPASTPPPAAPAAAPTPAKPVRQHRGPHRMAFDKTPPEARKKAAAVLEVLAGLRSCPQAAEALGLSLPAYYNLESRALEALVNGCMPVAKGRQKGPTSQVLERKCQKLQQEVQRYQALVRAQQRSTGLTPPPAPTKAKGKRCRRPTVRALKVAQQLNAAAAATDAAA